MAQVDLDPPSLITREGPTRSSPFCPGRSWPPPLITRGGPAPFQPLPAQVDLGLPPLITREGSAPFQPLPAQVDLGLPPLITKGGYAPFQPLPAQVDLGLPPLTPSCPGGSWPPPPITRGAPPPSGPVLPFIYQAWPLESQSTEKLSTRMDLEWRLAASPAPTPCFWIMYVILLLSHFRKLHLKCCQMIGCLVLITVVF